MTLPIYYAGDDWDLSAKLRRGAGPDDLSAGGTTVVLRVTDTLASSYYGTSETYACTIVDAATGRVSVSVPREDTETFPHGPALLEFRVATGGLEHTYQPVPIEIAASVGGRV